MRGDMYFSIDVEADGPIPGQYSMISVGIAVAGTFDAAFTPADPTVLTFYRELRPISENYIPEALAVSGLDRAELERSGADPVEAMAELRSWVEATAGQRRPVAVGYPACYDWMFLYWYLLRYANHSPFGHSGCLDMKTMYAVKAGVPLGGAVKARMPKHLMSTRRHTHNALDDAIEQADLFANLMRWTG